MTIVEVMRGRRLLNQHTSLLSQWWLSTNPPRGHTHHHDDHHHSTTMISDHQQNRKLTSSLQKESTPPGQAANSHTRSEHHYSTLHRQQAHCLGGEEVRFKKGAEYKTWEEGDARTIPRLFEIRYLAAGLGWEDFSLLALLPSLSSSLLSLSLSLCIVNIWYCSLPCVETLPHWRAGWTHHPTRPQ